MKTRLLQMTPGFLEAHNIMRNVELDDSRGPVIFALATLPDDQFARIAETIKRAVEAK
jgi:hypothetical protein